MKQPTPPAPPEPSRVDVAWLMAIELLASIVVWGLIGWLADLVLRTGPALKVTGLVVGTAAGITLLWQRGSAASYSEDRETNHKHG